MVGNKNVWIRYENKEIKFGLSVTHFFGGKKNGYKIKN